MPDDDIILSVRQVAGFTPVDSTGSADTVLLQRGGLGGPYVSIDANAFARTALEEGGPLAINQAPPADSAPGEVYGGHFNTALDGGSGYNAYTVALTDWYYLADGPAAALTFGPNAGWEFNVAPFGSAGDLAPMAAMMTLDFEGNLAIAGAMSLGIDPQGPMDATSAQWVEAAIAALRASTVWSVNGQRGDIRLDVSGVAGAAPIFSPRFQGAPRAPTPEWCDSSSRLATTAWVQRLTISSLNNLLNDHPFVFSFNGRTGDVVLTSEDLEGFGDLLAPLASPAFTGTPTAPTPAPTDDSDTLATTAFVTEAVTAALAAASGVFAPIDSPTFTGYPSGPTAAAGSATGQLATTAFVMDAVTEGVAGVASFNTRTGAVTLESLDITDAGGALLASPNFTGQPTAPTASPGATSSQIATCAWVMNELGGVTTGVVSFNGRGGAVILTSADLSAAGGALLNSPIFTGTPTAPTATTGTNNGQLATTAFVMEAIASINTGVISFNGRSGAVALTSADISAAGGAVLASPNFTGAPSAPTPAQTDNSTHLATTAFVMAAVGAAGGVATFNGRAGAVTLSSADVNATSAGGPYLSLASANARQNRNRLINGSFLIDQVHAYAGVSWPVATLYNCDRWYGAASVAGVMSSRCRAGGNGFQSSGAPAANTLFFSVGTASVPTAAQRTIFFQSIEYGLIADLLWGTSNAAPVTLSFWVQASNPGTYSGAMRNYAATRAYPFTFAITAANTWQFFTITIPGDQTGAWLTGNQLGGGQLTFSLGTGTNQLAPAGAWATGAYLGATGEFALTSVAGATLEFANIQLEVGTQATPFDWKATGDVQAQCQRYLQYPTMQFLILGYSAAGGGVAQAYTFPVSMRAGPTVGLTAPVYSNASGLTATQSDPYGWRASITATATATASVNFSATFNADI
jgi:hypothetical protein